LPAYWSGCSNSILADGSWTRGEQSQPPSMRVEGRIRRTQRDMSSLPIKLSDNELDAVMAAARPLPVEMRDAFLQAVARALRRCNGDIGPGLVHRVVRELQPEFFDPPDLAPRRSGSKPCLTTGSSGFCAGALL
jgi:hypothetical protein